MTSAVTKLSVPFQRERSHTLGELRAHRGELLRRRDLDPQLAEELRAPSGSNQKLVKLLKEELWPVLRYAEHERLSDEVEFIVMPEGHKVDVRVLTPSAPIDFQITVADACWDYGGASQPLPGGYENRLSMEFLNRYGIDGPGPVKKKTNGTAVRQREMVSTWQIEDAHRKGLIEALTKKFQKDYGIDEVTLIVYAQKFCEWLSPDLFNCLVRDSIRCASAGQNATCKFSSVVVLDNREEYFVRMRGCT